ncbi:unnamed protein product [Brassica rapa]|uniref:Uncharacterized protein n=1 Tax=Brassica campestris TaxID=3711 RepID=A0A8D9I1U6_BRACM|nr:unnamed protein product [Brassica rapa]
MLSLLKRNQSFVGMARCKDVDAIAEESTVEKLCGDRRSEPRHEGHMF